jgi:hypothetical protein
MENVAMGMENVPRARPPGQVMMSLLPYSFRPVQLAAPMNMPLALTSTSSPEYCSAVSVKFAIVYSANHCVYLASSTALPSLQKAAAAAIV